MKLIHLSEARRMMRRAKRVNREGFARYDGDLEQVIRKIIESCWNGGYFQVSSGHFNEFYCRDFGMCAEALVDLGYRDRVVKTLDYALSKFMKHGRMTTTISPRGRCFDFPRYGADSLPFIVHAVRVSGADGLLEKHGGFIGDEVEYYRDRVFDAKNFLVRRDRHFSSIKDYAKRSSSCYSNSMLYMLSQELDSLGLKNPFPADLIKEAVGKSLWNGNFFYDDLSRSRVVTGDANTFPFWCRLEDSAKRFRRCLGFMEDAGLTDPFPLKYTSEAGRIHRMSSADVFSGGYERDTVWMHLGLCFLDVVKRFDRKRFSHYMGQYEGLVMKHRNFLEVYDRDGEPFRTKFYSADESMLWAAKLLHLKKS